MRMPAANNALVPRFAKTSVLSKLRTKKMELILKTKELAEVDLENKGVRQWDPENKGVNGNQQ